MNSPHWFPDEYLGVAATLAHADELIDALGQHLFAYQTQPAGVVQLNERTENEMRHVFVESITPIPQKIPHLAADALNALRAAIEHTVFIGATEYEGGRLEERAARLVEMPAVHSYDSFMDWTRKRAKHGPQALRDGTELNKRIFALQPLHRKLDPSAHPLARLVALTNNSKHRTPAVAAVRIPAVIRDDQLIPNPHVMPKENEKPIARGNVIFSAPADQVVPITLFPTVGIEVPNTGRWPVLMHEIGEIADWIRKQAIPRLIVSGNPPEPEIPAWYDISTGYANLRAGVESGTLVSAYERSKLRLAAATVRRDLTDTIADMPNAPSREVISYWLTSIRDEEVLRWMGELLPNPDDDYSIMRSNLNVLQGMRDAAALYASKFQ